MFMVRGKLRLCGEVGINLHEWYSHSCSSLKSRANSIDSNCDVRLMIAPSYIHDII